MPMRVFILSAIAIAMSVSIMSATAAELSLGRRHDYVVERQQHMSRTIIRHHRRYVWKQIGMPCLLMPNEIVRRDWNGPQCRWADNL